MMPEEIPFEKRSFNVGMNGDDSLTKLAEGEYFNAYNFRGYTSESGHVSGLQSLPGTTLLVNALPIGTNYFMGGCEDEGNSRFVWGNWNSNGNHAIYCYDLLANTIYIVLLSTQVVGGLNLDRFHYIHSCFVINRNWYWTDDGYNEPRRLNIEAGIKLNQPTYVTTYLPYVAPLNQSVIAWIRRPPGLAPLQQKILESPVPASNFIGDQSFQFCWRFQYRDYEYSTLSPLSNTAGFNEQDPPPAITDLNITNVPLVTVGPGGQGYLATSYLLTPTPSPAYGPGVFAKITRIGTGGANAGAVDIDIPLIWDNYPATRSYTRVIVEGLNNYFRNLPGNGSPGQLSGGNLPASTIQSGKWYISYRDGVHPTLNIIRNWDWGLGDTAFAPTTEAKLVLYSLTNAATRQYSRIDITLPISEKVDQDIIQVDLVSNNLISGVYSIIKSWKTVISADAAAIAAHNSGAAALIYRFYNNQVGIVLDSAYSVKPFDSVALKAKTVEIAKNRSFMGNYIAGYDSSNLTTSLSLSFTPTVVGSPIGSFITGEWFLFGFFGGPAPYNIRYIVRTTQPVLGLLPASPYYYYTTTNAQPPFPASISTGLIFVGSTLSAVLSYYGGGQFAPLIDQGVSSALLSTNQSINFGVQAKAFKANAPVQLSITFYDNYQRKGGVITNDGLKITIPNTGFSANQYVTALRWALSNANAVAEIPPSAYYYSINVTKCLRTRFFVESIGFVIYASKSSVGVLSFATSVYNSNLAGVGIDISFLISNGMGYTFTAGDVVSFYLGGSYYALSITGQSGNFILCELKDVGTLGSGSLAQYEIYTPYKQQTNEPYYEVGEMFSILNPGTNSRAYSLTAGVIAGDVFLFQRSNGGKTYIAEAMSPNNKYYLLWFTDSGRPNFTDPIGQVNKTNSVAFSNTFVQGSRVNGLSTFNATDVQDLSQEFGDLQKLILSGKIQKEGTVLLAISIRETVSLYLGETQVAAPQGNAFLATSTGVIGTVYPLKGSFGTTNPESAVRFRGDVFWIDANNGGPVQYSDNGLELVSKYKMRTFWRRYLAKYKTLTPLQIEALGSRPFIIGGIDPFNEELLFSIPQVEAANPNGVLPGYVAGTAPPNLFDPYDGMAKTMVYKIGPNRWMPAIQYVSEGFITSGNLLYGYKTGNLHRHNDVNAPANTFYGVPYAAMILFAPNELPNTPKLYLAINVEASAPPSSLIMMATYPNTQITDIVSAEWNNKEGVYYATIRRDRLSPQYADFNQALNYGDKMITKAPMIQLNFGVDVPNGVVTPVYFQLKYVNIGYEESSGHKTGNGK